MVSCRCTSRITRDFRSRSSCEILRTRMASSICCRSIGWIAENMKKSQNRSPIDYEPSDMGPPRDVSAGGWLQEGYYRLQNLKQKPQTDKDERVDFEE